MKMITKSLAIAAFLLSAAVATQAQSVSKREGVNTAKAEQVENGKADRRIPEPVATNRENTAERQADTAPANNEATVKREANNVKACCANRDSTMGKSHGKKAKKSNTPRGKAYGWHRNHSNDDKRLPH